MSRTFSLCNRQRAYPVDVYLLRRILRCLLKHHFQPDRAELGVCLVDAPEMTRVNETFLRHAGSTDVITFNHGAPGQSRSLIGDILICVDEAAVQARRFRTTWQSELVRYLIHGLLHLQGYDDACPPARRKMKREEDRLLKEIAKQFPLHFLSAADRRRTTPHGPRTTDHGQLTTDQRQ